ncbi:hypothetical protein CKAN_00124400 [Cinnamomum micranthum f. kanehirae]|uniref:Uncharacterized protein n=1 Tax=Cinnamomum micranthum f. kanehirae TaxID=337451 RepID=A0A3S3PUC6_9MAGN|nr:hypothetical protein CKAN_00124400 [Cinnamomum micranthum f. kanehirae]
MRGTAQCRVPHTGWGLDTSPRSATSCVPRAVWSTGCLSGCFLEILATQSLPSRRDEIFHSVVDRDGHGYTLTYGTGIPRSHIVRAESSGASSSQGLRLRTDEEVEELLQSMKAAIREEVTNKVRAEMRAELRAELAKLEARLSQSRSPFASDPPPTTQAPVTGSGHRARYDSVGEGSHDPAGSTDPDQMDRRPDLFIDKIGPEPGIGLLGSHLPYIEQSLGVTTLSGMHKVLGEFGSDTHLGPASSFNWYQSLICAFDGLDLAIRLRIVGSRISFIVFFRLHFALCNGREEGD